MKEPTMEEKILDLVEPGRNITDELIVKAVEMCSLVIFHRDERGDLYVKNITSSVRGDVYGDIDGDVYGHVHGKINGRRWQYVDDDMEE